MDGTTRGRCQASCAIKEYHHMYVKRNNHKMIVQPATLYGMETVPVTSSHVKKLEVTEMTMCRWAYGHTLRDNTRKGDIRERLKIDNITEKYRKARLGGLAK